MTLFTPAKPSKLSLLLGKETPRTETDENDSGMYELMSVKDSDPYTGGEQRREKSDFVEQWVEEQQSLGLDHRRIMYPGATFESSGMDPLSNALTHWISPKADAVFLDSLKVTRTGKVTLHDMPSHGRSKSEPPRLRPTRSFFTEDDQ